MCAARVRQSAISPARDRLHRDAERPRGPIPLKSTGRSYNLDDDTSPDVDLADMDDFATSKPNETEDTSKPNEAEDKDTEE